jgi:hypothetical protein
METMRGGTLAAALVGALALAGCASQDLGPSSAELTAQWESQNILPKDYKNDLLAFLRTYLNDPTHVRNAGVAEPTRKAVPGGERYVVCLRYNARDTDGKYTGTKEGAAVYVSAKLDRFIDVKRDAHDLCKGVVYAPFPELEKLTR